MALPRIDDLLVEQAGLAQALLVHLLIALRIVAGGIILFGTVGSRYQVEHGIIALVAQLGGVGAQRRGDVFPHLRGHVGGDVHHAAVADDERGFGALLSHGEELVLQGELYLERGFLALIEQVLVVGEVVHARLREQRGHFRYGKHFVTEAGEMLDDLYERGGLPCARPSGEDDSLYVFVHDIV